MKSLVVTEFFPPAIGGIQTYIYNVCHILPKQMVTVLAPEIGKYESFDSRHEFKVYREKIFLNYPLLMCLSRTILPLIHSLRLLKREGFSLTVCGHVSWMCLSIWILKELTRRPYLVFCHGFDVMSLPKPLQKWLLSKADALVANSAYTREFLLQSGLKDERIFIISPGTDTNRFSTDVDCSAVDEKHSLKGKKVILTVSRLADRKNHEIVIKALPKVLEKVPDAVYLIVGDGPERKRLEALAAKFRVRDKVIFAGLVPDDELPKYYAACDVFVLLSKLGKRGDFEGFGIVYAEASASGKPIIYSGQAGSSESVVDKVTGLKVRSDDLRELTETLVKLLTDHKLAKTLGENGRARAITRLNWEAVGRRLRHILSSLSSGVKDDAHD